MKLKTRRTHRVWKRFTEPMNIFRRLFLSFFSWTLILSPIFSLLPPQTPTALAQNAPERQTQFLIKQDGSLLEGVINVSGGYYTVEVAQGKGILYVRKEQVYKVVDSIAQAYQEKLQTMVYQDAREFLSLAEWCIQNKLYPQAQEALNQAQKQQNNHPMIKVYQRRLDLAQEQALREAQQEQAQAQTRETSDSGLSGNSEENGRANANNATAVNLEEEANRQILLQQRALEQMARNMPGDTLKQFTSEIQPLLQSGCGTASCHGAETQTDFKIIPSASKARSLTLRNLYSALRQVNRENPQNSPLLTKAVEAHGQLEVPIFSKSRASAYSRLVSWTYRVTRPARIYSVEQTHFLDQTIGRHSKEEKAVNPFEQAFWEEAETPPEPTGTGKSEPAETEPVAEPSAVPGANSSPSATFPDASDQDAQLEPGASRQKTGLQNGLPNKRKTSTVQRGNPTPETYEAMDPFDPNTFNNLQTGIANNTPGSAIVPPDQGAGLAPGTTIQSAIQPGTSGSAVVQFTPDGYKAASSQTAAPVIPAWSNATQPAAAGEPSLIQGNGTRNKTRINPGFNSEMPSQPSIVSQSSVISAPGTFGGINNTPDQVMAKPNYGIQPGPEAQQYMQTPAQQMLNRQSVPQDDEPVAIIRNGKLISGSSAWENPPQVEEPVNRKPTAKTNSSQTNRSYSTSPEDAGYDELPRVDLLFGGK